MDVWDYRKVNFDYLSQSLDHTFRYYFCSSYWEKIVQISTKQIKVTVSQNVFSYLLFIFRTSTSLAFLLSTYCFDSVLGSLFKFLQLQEATFYKSRSIAQLHSQFYLHSVFFRGYLQSDYLILIIINISCSMVTHVHFCTSYPTNLNISTIRVK